VSLGLFFSVGKFYVILSQMTLYIFGQNLGFVFQKDLARFSFVPFCNQGKLLYSIDYKRQLQTSNWIKPNKQLHIVLRVTVNVEKILTFMGGKP